jgi:hypothetical protein
MFGDGAALEDDEEDDLVEAQPAAITATASERRESCLTRESGIGIGGTAIGWLTTSD